MTRPGIEPRSPGPLANTLTARPMSGKYKHIHITKYEGMYICIYMHIRKYKCLCVDMYIF